MSYNVSNKDAELASRLHLSPRMKAVRLGISGANLLVLSAMLACGDGAQTGGGIARRGYGGSGGDPDPTQSPDPGGTTPTPAPTSTSTAPNPNPNPSPAAGITINLDKTTASADLNAQTTVLVNVAPTNGFSGNVDLSVTGNSADVTATFDKTQLAVNGASASATLTLKTMSNTAPSTQTLTVTARSGSITQNARVAFTVNPVIEIRIPANVDALRVAGGGTIQSTAYGPNPLNLKLGTATSISVKVFNADTVPHQLHAANGAQGFAHGNVIAANSYEEKTQVGVPRTVNAPGTYSFYLHDGTDGQSVTGRIVVTQ
jgi:hypothetical protein